MNHKEFTRLKALIKTPDIKGIHGRIEMSDNIVQYITNQTGLQSILNMDYRKIQKVVLTIDTYKGEVKHF